jgi:hypothetical protein
MTRIHLCFYPLTTDTQHRITEQATNRGPSGSDHRIRSVADSIFGRHRWRRRGPRCRRIVSWVGCYPEGVGVHIIQALDNVFCVDKVEDSGLKLFGSDCGLYVVRRGGTSIPC